MKMKEMFKKDSKMAKKYAVKITAVATPENVNFRGETQVYYIGKDGYVHDLPNEVSLVGWSHPRWAQKYIDKDSAWDDEWNYKHWKAWNRTYEIVTL